jgi:hypothetical protein
MMTYGQVPSELVASTRIVEPAPSVMLEKDPPVTRPTTGPRIGN